MTTGLTEYDRIVVGLMGQGVPRERAESAARVHLHLPPPADSPRAARDDARREQEIEAAGDRLMQERGFEVIRFSHPGKTKQTPGIPDRRYYRRPRNQHERPLIVWVEYKSATGHQRPGQRLFQEMCEACGEEYVLAASENS